MSYSNTKQIGGSHYRTNPDGVQHWDYCVAQNVPYLEAASTKYLIRWRKKNGLQDLEKALHYTQKRLESVRAGVGILRGARRNQPLFKELLRSNEVPLNESIIIDTIMHWRNEDHLTAAISDIRAMIAEAKQLCLFEGDATAAYVNQDR